MAVEPEEQMQEQMQKLTRERVSRQLKSGFELGKFRSGVQTIKNIGFEVPQVPEIKNETALVMASGRGDINQVRHLLNPKSDAMQSCHQALFAASFNGHSEVVELLVEHGVHIDDNSSAPLIAAIQCGHYEVVKILLTHGGGQPGMQISRDMTAWMLAIHHNRIRIIKLMLACGAQPNMQIPNGMTALMMASMHGHSKLAKLLLDNGAKPNICNDSGVPALIFAVQFRHYAVVELLVKYGAEVNFQVMKCTALQLASSRGLYDICKLLLEHGAQVNLCDGRGVSPLTLACYNEHYNVAALMIKRGAQLNLQDETGTSALMAASSVGHRKIVELLLQGGARPDLQSNTGATALFLSSLDGYCNVTEVLLRGGAQVDKPTAKGVSPLMCASTFKVAKLLLDHGARINTVDVNGSYPLHFSISRKKREVAKLLLAKGAQPQLQNSQGSSALAMAVVSRQYGIIKLLLRSSQVDRTDVWQILRISTYKCGQDITVLLFEKCLHFISTTFFDSGFPRVVFWDAPTHHCITSQGATIQSPHTGISLSIPDQALSSTEKDVDLLIHPCLNGPFQLPAGYESASPTYLIQPDRKVKIQRDITLQIHHYISLQSKEDCGKMVFLSASPTPQYRRCRPVYIFKEIKHSQGVFRPNSHIGEIVVRHFCFVKIGRRRRVVPLQGDPSSLYSVRMYRGSLKDGASAVFCMCLYSPLYIEHCDRKIADEYKARSCFVEGKSERLAQMTGDDIKLTVHNAKGWNVKFDKTPATIKKRDLNIPLAYSKLTDYPPKFFIFAHSTGKGTSSDSPQLVVQGLDVEDCSFEIITPGSSRSISVSPTPSDSQSILNSISSEASTSVSSAEVTTPTGQNPSRDPSLSLKCILTELVTINKEWLNLGIALELRYRVLEEIEANYPNNVRKCMAEVINKWLETSTGQLSWKTLCNALRNELVNCPVLAAQIEQKYCVN